VNLLKKNVKKEFSGKEPVKRKSKHPTLEYRNFSPLGTYPRGPFLIL
jgi:hypothetical protein